ncbi:hypothetical protein ACLOJK_009780 [Asimina triloba]
MINWTVVGSVTDKHTSSASDWVVVGSLTDECTSSASGYTAVGSEMDGQTASKTGVPALRIGSSTGTCTTARFIEERMEAECILTSAIVTSTATPTRP